MRDASSQDLASPRGANIHAALEQTDALLLYTYGFWCEDQGGGARSSHRRVASDGEDVV